jgi:hypothetical protein
MDSNAGGTHALQCFNVIRVLCRSVLLAQATQTHARYIVMTLEGGMGGAHGTAACMQAHAHVVSSSSGPQQPVAVRQGFAAAQTWRCMSLGDRAGSQD